MTETETAVLSTRMDSLEKSHETLIKQIGKLVDAMGQVNVRLAQGALTFVTRDEFFQMKESLGTFMKVADCKDMMCSTVQQKQVSIVWHTLKEAAKLSGWFIMAGLALWRLLQGA